MSKPSRSSLSPSSPTSSSKLPKFLQKQSRDRSRSVNDSVGRSSPVPSSMSTTALDTQLQMSPSIPSPVAGRMSDVGPSTSASASAILAAGRQQQQQRKGSRFRTRGGAETDVEKFQQSGPAPLDHRTFFDSGSLAEEPAVVIEPASPITAGGPPRSRSTAVPVPSSNSDTRSAYYPSSASTSRLGDLPTRLSGWLSHTFSTSATDLSLPSILNQAQNLSPSTSPSGKSSSSALLTAAKHGKAHLNTAMRYILDSDSTPDKCTDPIWLLGVQHSGYEPPPASSPPSSVGSARRSSIDSRRSGFSGSTHHSISSKSSETARDPALSQSQPASSKNHPAAHWPPVFYADFTSRLWLTYRSHFAAIRDGDLSALDDYMSAPENLSTSPSSSSKRWNWVGGEKGWTSDSGWGCMLRTGQSLLANTLIHLHLGRDWRRPPHAVKTVDYATYVHIVSWFLDNPSPLCPFSVHRMALAGKTLGTDVGQWFGPAIAAGAIKSLVNSFPEAGIGVAVAVDQMLYTTDVLAASNSPSPIASPSRRKDGRSVWGGRAVLILATTKLGIHGVNPVYYETVKTLFTFPQSVGIAGGRPRSSYYFVGSQSDTLFYLDPHHARPAVPLRPPPINEGLPPPTNTTATRDREGTPDSSDPEPSSRTSPPLNRHKHTHSPTSPSSVRTGSSTFSYHARVAPSPLQHQFSGSTSTTASAMTTSSSRLSTSPPSAFSFRGHTGGSGPGAATSSVGTGGPGEDLTAAQEHYVHAYSPSELRTYHCDRVRKMQLSGLDPSMLIGFLVRDERDWIDFQRRMAELPRHTAIFSIQDEPPSWPSTDDLDIGMDSVSEPDMDDMDDPSDYSAASEPRRKSSEVDTEEDPVDPVTPGANQHSRDSSKSDAASRKQRGDASRLGEATIKQKHFGDTILIEDDDDEDGLDDDEDWVDPAISTPLAHMPPSQAPLQPLILPSPTPSSLSSHTKSGSGSVRSTKGKERKPPVPVPIVRAPSSSSSASASHSHAQDRYGREYEYEYDYESQYRQRQQQGPQHVAFPSSADSMEDGEDEEGELVEPPSPSVSRIIGGGGGREKTAGAKGQGGQPSPNPPRAPRGRDGGRTQSGGVRGVPYYDEE